ncbi:SCO family protein [Gemmobacter aquarius]|uniref:SCO family protein n=1 Tax=Paragemmobacter aquarius TaxID=2169400 RepID=A0A2S0URR2_9RHOB|nr:SCO family protein [Gemmobacter aquarius]AWB50483.1 SCO family protein [Gemmobacter aquarius]
MDRIYVALAAAVTVGLVGGVYGYAQFAKSSDPYADCRGGTVGGGDIGGPFTLVDQNGETVTDVDVLTKPSLVYFGYTYCPDVCPLDAARNAEAVDILEEQGFEAQPVFISIDPDRDTPSALKEFAANIDDRMVALTGTPEQVAQASKAYRTYFKKQEGDDPEFYLMDHSTFTYLVLPKKGFVDFFRRDDSAELIAQRTACYLSK